MGTDNRYWQIFFQVFESLPRQGPGSRACTAQPRALCRELPAAPEIIDFGCGFGAQTLDLASLTAGRITAEIVLRLCSRGTKLRTLCDI